MLFNQGLKVKEVASYYIWNGSTARITYAHSELRALINTRTGKGGQILPSPHVFSEYLSKYSFDRRDFFNTCPKINGAPFGVKIEDASIFGGLFLSPQISTFVFRRADAMTGVSWRPPPAPAGWARPVARGGGGRPGAGRGCRPGARGCRPSAGGGGEEAPGQGHG